MSTEFRKQFSRLKFKSQNHFQITQKKKWEQVAYLDGVKERIFDYAFEQAILRNSGISLGEKFIKIFLHKIAEFGVHQYFSREGYSLIAPDLRLVTDETQEYFEVTLKGVRVVVSWIPFYSNLFLFERNQFNEVGEYRYQKNGAAKNGQTVHLLSRIFPDGLEIMKREKWLQAPDLEVGQIKEVFLKNHFEVDIPGYLTADQLKYLYQQDYLFPKEGTLNGKTPLGKDFIFCQAGELEAIREIDKLWS